MTYKLTLRFFQGFYYQAQFNTAGTECFRHTIILNFLTFHNCVKGEKLAESDFTVFCATQETPK